jgi:hypothetical protein
MTRSLLNPYANVKPWIRLWRGHRSLWQWLIDRMLIWRKAKPPSDTSVGSRRSDVLVPYESSQNLVSYTNSIRMRKYNACIHNFDLDITTRISQFCTPVR